MYRKRREFYLLGRGTNKLLLLWSVLLYRHVFMCRWLTFFGLFLPSPNSLIIACKARHGRARAHASTNTVAPGTNYHHEYCGGGAFATIVLLHVIHDVAFALLTLPLYLPMRPASQALPFLVTRTATISTCPHVRHGQSVMASTGS